MPVIADAAVISTAVTSSEQCRGIVQRDEEAGPLNSSEAEEDARVGLDEVAEQAEGHVGDHEEFEGVAGPPALVSWRGRRTARFSTRRRVRSGSLEMTRRGYEGTPRLAGAGGGIHGVLRFAQDDRLSLHANFFQNNVEERDQCEEEDDFVELGGVARDAVAEVNGHGRSDGMP